MLTPRILYLAQSCCITYPRQGAKGALHPHHDDKATAVSSKEIFNWLSEEFKDITQTANAKDFFRKDLLV